MAWCGRIFGFCAALSLAIALSGCLGQQCPPGKLPVSRDTPFVFEVPETEKNTTARFQQAEMPPPPPPSTNQPPAPTGVGLTPPAPPGQSATPTPMIQQASHVGASKAQGPVHVSAWVNGKPIFEDEVFNYLLPQLKAILTQTAPEKRDETVRKAFNTILESLVDKELLMQDAIRQLEKNPKILEKLKEIAAKDVQKKINEQMRNMKVATLDEYKQVLLSQNTTVESVRHMLEREVFAGEYFAAKFRTVTLKEICHEVIYDYYKEHLNEFMQVDRVKWQDIFIAVGPKHPTMSDARQFAEQLLARWKAGEDLAELLKFDDGDSSFRKGEGAGENKGDIKPRELEPYLMALKEGEFGPPVELSTGVHIYRVLKRDYAGVMPFNDKTQGQIKKKLENELAEQERAHMIRRLRERALIEIEH